MKHWKLGLIAALFSGSLYAAPLEVVSSFSILGDVAKQVGGERVNVSSLVGPDQDAHAYNLTSRDMHRIRNAKLVLVNGLGFEQAAVMRGIRQSGTPFAEATKNIRPMKAEEHDDHDHDHGHHGHDHHHHGEFDPHVWNDPVLMKTYAQNVADALIRVDPQGRAYYQQRLTNYQGRLDAMHQWAQTQFNSVPAARRKVLTGHDAFNYLGKRYRVEFIAPQGVSTEAEPSARQVSALIRQIRSQNIRAAFSENIKDSRMVERISRETGIRVNGKLYSDALSRGAPAATYEQMFRHNVSSLVNAMKQ
ncbi:MULTISPECIES: metal ABC transporter solute-binding protein, Zn/Mn family [Eikenella]|uniref:metal ABC transporter solute-binding protein, Zn/Mn family n=1 Tax=Eikenella TaxID=538 RepID=UPI0015CFC52C|nr:MULTISPECIES: zinc ABC transporter substrate-binding protein [Eikenella]